MANLDTLLSQVSVLEDTLSSTLGLLHFHKMLTVQRVKLRRYMAYLFDKAIIFITRGPRQSYQTKSRSTSRSSKRSSHRSASYKTLSGADRRHYTDASATPKPRVKGRLYFRGIKGVENTSNEDVYSLVITMVNPEIGDSTLVFKDKVTLEQWEKRICELMSGRRSMKDLPP